MISTRNNHVFKGHKTLLGSRFVTYAEVELPLRNELFSKIKDGFDWGHTGPAPTQLGFSMLCQLGDEEFAKEYAPKFTNEVITSLTTRDWVLKASDVIKWINNNSEEIQQTNIEVQKPKSKKHKKSKDNVVKNICKGIGITQKNLAEILEVPEGTVSSWAVKNEIPRLGKKAIEFYILNKKNQEIVDSYKQFTKLLNT